MAVDTKTVAEHMNFPGATALAQRIEQFWRDRGYHGIKTFIEANECVERKAGGGHMLYSVRSNIGPLGYPPAVPARVAA